jgi:hypothetical protein
MTWTMTYRASEGILSIETAGVLTIDKAEQLRTEALLVLLERKCTRCLLDHRGLTSEQLGVYNIYQIPQQYDQQKISRAIHLALVVRQDHKENFIFYENVCRNAGYQAATFIDSAAAEAWLKKE